MKLKVTLRRAGTASDLVIVADGTATVGDVASALHRSDPAHAGAPAEHPPLSLQTTDVGAVASTPRVVPVGTPIADSGIRSGSVLDVVAVDPAFTVAGQDRGPAAAVLRVLAGPDAGREFPLPVGATIIGRDASADIRLGDALVSKAHARINVGDGVEIIDLNSANGVQVSGGSVARITVTSSDVVVLGDTSVTITALTRASATPVVSTVVEHVRPPRYVPRYPGREFTAPTPPKPPQPQRFPILALVAPLVVGAVLFALTRQILGVVMMGMTPVLLVGTYIDQRMSGRRLLKAERARFDGAMAHFAEKLEKERADERTVRLLEAPSLRESVEAIERLGPLLWAHRPEHAGFLNVRLGVGRSSSRNRVALPGSNDTLPEFWSQLEELALDSSTVDGVPIMAPLRRSGALGLAGPRAALDPVARGVVLQAISLHSPAELIVTAFTSPASMATWRWLLWLPHTGSAHSPVAGHHLADNAVSGAVLLASLEELVAVRSTEAPSPRGSLDPGEREEIAQPMIPSVLVVVEDDAPVDRGRLTRLAERGADVNVHLVWVAARSEQLPAACRSFLTVDQTASGAIASAVRTGDRDLPVHTEGIDAADAERLARALAPVIDVGAPENDDSDLPRAVSYAAVAGRELLADSGGVVERWLENGSLTLRDGSAPVRRHSETTLRALVGHAGSEPFHLDLRTEGPHALVGGTTGAGKSEFLQSWVLGMAAAYSPDHVTFLFVDYKGGAAFKDLLPLPHTVGLVTDLSPHLVRRALTSLRAELKYREELLERKDAKSLVELEKSGDPDCPPSLIIVVDEFAALVQDVPEFVDGVVDVAQRGRSLGLHLILATQRPAGVIKDNLRGNTNLRIALRMADGEDSTDILGVPVAAGFDPTIPGRGMAKSGPGRLVGFQTGYAGGWTTDEPPTPRIDVSELGFGAGAAWVAPEGPVVTLPDPGPTDIVRIVSTVAAAARAAGVPEPRKPWLKVLADVYDLKVLPKPRSDDRILIGVLDDPSRQEQPTVLYEPDRDGNMAIFGTGGAGKSTALRTIATSAGMTVRGGPVQIYGLDFGAAGLAMLGDLPHVGAIIDGDDEERVIRLLRMLRDLVDDRTRRYGAVRAGSIKDYRDLAGAPDEPRILLLVDGIGAFREKYEFASNSQWFTAFSQIAADGRPLGVHIVMTGDRPNSIPPSISATVQRRIVLRLAAEDDYTMLGVPKDILGPTSPPGRGLLDGDELQLALLGSSPNVAVQSREIAGLAQSLARSGAPRPMPIERLPERVPLSVLPLSLEGAPVIGLGDVDLGPAVIVPRGTFLITGPPGSGRTTALTTVVTAIARARNDLQPILFGSRRTPLGGRSGFAEVWTGASDVAAAAARISEEIASGTRRATSTVLVLEGATDFSGTEAEYAIEPLLKLVAREGGFVVAEAEASAWNQAYQLRETFKSWRNGLLLAPSDSDGDNLLGTPLGRIRRADFPAGRGFLVLNGRAEKVQVADSDS